MELLKKMDKLISIQPKHVGKEAATNYLKKVLSDLDNDINFCMSGPFNKTYADAYSFIKYVENTSERDFYDVVTKAMGRSFIAGSDNEMNRFIESYVTEIADKSKEVKEDYKICFPVIFMSRELYGTIIDSNAKIVTVYGGHMVEYNEDAKGLCNIRCIKGRGNRQYRLYRNFLIVCEDTLGSEYILDLYELINGKNKREAFEKEIKRQFERNYGYGYYCVKNLILGWKY